MSRAKAHEVFARLGAVTLTLALGFALIEIAARLWLHHLASLDQFVAFASISQIEARSAEGRKLEPHRHLGYVTARNYRRGLNHHNALGFRGGEIASRKPQGVYRIVCLGGSTTYSSAVEDPDDAYPALLEAVLHAAGYPQVDVVNAGVPGYGTLETLINFELRVLDLEPDLIVVNHAVNDIHARLVWPPEAYRGDNSGSTGPLGLTPLPPIAEHSTALRTAMVRLGWTTPHGSLERSFGPPPESHFTRLLHAQIMAGSYPEGPFEDVSIGQMLERNRPIYFERHLRNLVTLAGSHGIEAMLTTFPYHHGWTGRSPIAIAEYRDAIAELNRLTLQIAESTPAHGLDLASQIPADERLYVDGYHFTREGNALRGRILGEWFVDSMGPALQREPASSPERVR